MKKVTLEEHKKEIIYLHEIGLSVRKLAKKYNVAINTMGRLLKEWEGEGEDVQKKDD